MKPVADRSCEKSPAAMPGPGTGGEINLEAGMVNYALRIIYKFHRRKESSKSWRSRYTPRWKRFLTDGSLKTWESTRVDLLTAISQLAHERAGLSAPHTLPSSQRDLVKRIGAGVVLQEENHVHDYLRGDPC